jgi:hypothetical protein
MTATPAKHPIDYCREIRFKLTTDRSGSCIKTEPNATFVTTNRIPSIVIVGTTDTKQLVFLFGQGNGFWESLGERNIREWLKAFRIEI